jgi:uncharacterized protein YjdB
VHTLRRTTTWIAAAVAWSCGSITGADSDPSGSVASVDVAPSSFTLVVGAEAPLQATVRDESGRLMSEVPVVWSVKDTAIAGVTSTGMVSARSVGSTQVAASANGVSAIAAVTVQLPPVTSVVVQPLTQSLVPGGTVTFTATPRDVNGAALGNRVITWTSSDDGVATVSQGGVVGAHAVGTATISATSEGVTGSATITVSPAPVATVTVDPAASTLMRGATVQLVATLKDANGTVLTDRIVAWASSDDAVAIVSTVGVVSGMMPGAATISATSEGRSASASVTVVRPPLASVTVLPDTANIQVAGTATFTATLKDITGAVVVDRTVAWTSSNAAVATVSTGGVVTAVAPGTAAVTATSEGKSGSAVVTVTAVPVASITLDPSSVTLTAGQSATLVATTKGADGTVLTGRVVTFASNKPAVALVTSGGTVTGVAAGSAIITAMSEGKSATATVTVQPAVASVALSPPVAFLRRGGTVRLSATAYDASGNPITGRAVTWDSRDDHVATVDAAGVVEAKRSGTVTISATIDGKVGTMTVVVTN